MLPGPKKPQDELSGSYLRPGLSLDFYLVFPKLNSRAHFILRAPLPPLVDKAAPELPPPAAPCLPGDAMATRYIYKDR